MERYVRAPIAGILILVLPGCGINALRTQYATSVSTSGTEVAAASSAFLRQVEASRRLANIELVAADPACGTTPAFVRADVNVDQSAPGWLCRKPNVARQQGDVPLTLRPITAELQPTAELITSLSSYAQALADLVDEKPSDPMKPLLDALATARSAQGLLLAVTGSTEEVVPAADDKRVQAVTDFVGFLASLSDEAHQVSELRALIASHPQGAEPVLDALSEHLGAWENSRSADDGFRLQIEGDLVRRLIDANPPVSVDERRKALTNYYALQDVIGADRAIYPALTSSIDDLRQADRDLRRVLVEHPKLTRAERSQIAEINRQRAIRAMDTLSALVMSFKGV